MLKDFRDFINRGNVIDLAVAVVVGSAFGAITQSLVNDVVMPPVGLLLAGVDFNNMGIILQDSASYPSVPDAVAAGAPVLRYGAFLTTIINFLIISLAMFSVVRGYNQLRRRFQRQEAVTPGPPPAPSRQEVLLAEIRDLLAAQNAAGRGGPGGD
ncbi:MAG TPA: large-conductance mechanosensitive channel protein MscL [Trueperaceae bacterium]